MFISCRKFRKIYNSILSELVISIIKFNSIKERQLVVDKDLINANEEIKRIALAAAKKEFSVIKEEFEKKAKLNQNTEEDKKKYLTANQKVEDLNNYITSIDNAKKTKEKNQQNLNEQLWHLNYLRNNYAVLKQQLLSSEDKGVEYIEGYSH